MNLTDSLTSPQIKNEHGYCLRSFWKAVVEGNEELINLLLSKADFISTVFQGGWTPLHIVARRGTVETAAKMCQLGADVNFRSDYHLETPILHAVTHSAEMVRLLINNGASVDIQCTQGVTLLQRALLAGSEETVQIILNAIFTQRKSEDFQNLKYPISIQNSEEIIRTLFTYKKDLSLRRKDYPLLIFFIAKIGNLDLLKTTLDNSKEYLDFVEYREERNEKKNTSPLKEINFKGDFNVTALHLATIQQLPDAVRFLLEAGADVNCTNSIGNTPLHHAVCIQNDEICQILLNFGAEVNFKLEKLSPLRLLCGKVFGIVTMDMKELYFDHEYYLFMKNKPELKAFNLRIMKMLLEKGANPNIVYGDNKTPLMEACAAGDLGAVKILLEFGANIGAVDCKGKSPLHHVIYHITHCQNRITIQDTIGFLAVVEESFKTEDGKYNTTQNQGMDIIEYLVDFGANINARDGKGNTILYETSLKFKTADIIVCLLELGAIPDMSLIRKLFHKNSRCRYNVQNKILIAFMVLKSNSLDDVTCNFIMNQKNLENWRTEVEQLKSAKILKDMTLHDFLTRDIHTALRMIKNKEVRKAFTDNEYRNYFPCYKYYITKHFGRLKFLEEIVDEIIDFLQKYGEFNLPILVIEKIVSFLSAKDIRNFGRFLSEK